MHVSQSFEASGCILTCALAPSHASGLTFAESIMPRPRAEVAEGEQRKKDIKGIADGSSACPPPMPQLPSLVSKVKARVHLQHLFQRGLTTVVAVQQLMKMREELWPKPLVQ